MTVDLFTLQLHDRFNQMVQARRPYAEIDVLLDCYLDYKGGMA